MSYPKPAPRIRGIETITNAAEVTRGIKVGRVAPEVADVVGVAIDGVIPNLEIVPGLNLELNGQPAFGLAIAAETKDILGKTAEAFGLSNIYIPTLQLVPENRASSSVLAGGLSLVAAGKAVTETSFWESDLGLGTLATAVGALAAIAGGLFLRGRKQRRAAEAQAVADAKKYSVKNLQDEIRTLIQDTREIYATPGKPILDIVWLRLDLKGLLTLIRGIHERQGGNISEADFGNLGAASAVIQELITKSSSIVDLQLFRAEVIDQLSDLSILHSETGGGILGQVDFFPNPSRPSRPVLTEERVDFTQLPGSPLKDVAFFRTEAQGNFKTAIGKITWALSTISTYGARYAPGPRFHAMQQGIALGVESAVTHNFKLMTTARSKLQGLGQETQEIDAQIEVLQKTVASLQILASLQMDTTIEVITLNRQDPFHSTIKVNGTNSQGEMIDYEGPLLDFADLH